MKKTPILSVITICYNIKEEIERTCQSIVNQTWQDFEWIVVDGGSTDGTVEVLKKYQDRMSVFISEKDKGVYNAMNKGIKLAHGKWLNFMNGGDCFDTNDVLEKTFKDKKYDTDVLYGNVRIIYTNGTEKIRAYPQKLSLDFWKTGTVCHQSTFIRRRIFNEYGLYSENYRLISDWEKFFIAAYYQKKFEHLKLCVSKFFMGGSSFNDSLINNEKKCFFENFHPKKIRKYFLFNYLLLWVSEEQ